MVLIAVLVMSLGAFVAVIVATAVGYGLFRWVGSNGAWIGVALLTACVGFMLYIIRDNLVGAANQFADVRAVALWFCWGLGVPCGLAALVLCWMVKLAVSK